MSEVDRVVLSMAGFDPSGGAGILRDAIVIESFGLTSRCVPTCLTVQSEERFFRVEWMSTDFLVESFATLDRDTIVAAKIGVVSSLKMLTTIIDLLRARANSIPIIWDPVLQTSTGFTFLPVLDREELATLLARIDLITPNSGEARMLSGYSDPEQGALFLSKYCGVVLTGVRDCDGAMHDLYFGGEQQPRAYPITELLPDRHGTGCTFSTSIATAVVDGGSVEEAILTAQENVRQYRRSRTLCSFGGREKWKDAHA